jgi:hypothetical protein
VKCVFGFEGERGDWESFTGFGLVFKTMVSEVVASVEFENVQYRILYLQN